MAYDHGKYEVRVVAAADLATTGDKGNWQPGLKPHIIRGVAAVIRNDIGAAGTINFDKRPTAGVDTGRVHDVVAPLALTTAHLGGKVVFRDGLDVRINPGEELVVAADDAAAAGDLADVILYVEPSHERPGNIPAMVKSA